MKTQIENVVVAGARGNIGPAVVKGLLEGGFTVTVLSRSAETVKKELGDAVKAAEVDYSSHDSLVSALRGQHAVVVCGVTMVEEQTRLVDAAIAAGVPRFMPAAFGTDMRKPEIRALHDNRKKLAVEAYLQERAAQISYSTVDTGPLFDFCLDKGVIVNMKARSQWRIDDGTSRFSTTTCATAGRAVAAVLKLGDRSANRAFLVEDCDVTQKEILGMAEELTPGVEWAVSQADSEELLRKAAELFRVDPESRQATMMERAAAVFGKRIPAFFEHRHNQELGIPEMGREQIKALLKKYM